MRNNQILMFGGSRAMPITVYWPIGKKKKCVRCKEDKTDFIGKVCVDCVCKSKLNGGTKKNGKQ